MASVAIIQTAFIGDVVLATPLFEAARCSLPTSSIVAVVRAGSDNLLGNNPNIDDVIVWDKHGGDRGIGGIRRIAALLRQREVELAVIPHRSIRSALMARFAGIPTRIGFRKGGGRFLHSVGVNYPRDMHEVERNLTLAKAAGWRSDGFVPAIYPDDRDRMIVQDIVADAGAFCVFAPGSVWPTKMWPAEYYAEMGRSLVDRGLTVVLSGGMDDSDLCRALETEIPGAVNACGMLSLRQSAEMYRRADFMLTGDTAPQHMAAAMGTRVFSIFGPTVRALGFGPYSERGTIIEESLSCRPCGMHGHRSCPKGHHLCMRRITPDRVMNIIENDPDLANTGSIAAGTTSPS